MLEMILVLALAQAPAKPLPLPEVDSASAIFTEGKWLGDYRLRYEYVEDGAFQDPAKAWTLRSRTGFRTASFSNFSALVDAESIFTLKENYNSTDNRRTKFPVVADPDGSEINQAYLAYGWNTPTQVVIGRQRFVLDNQRFFGNVAFRQNEQTFDAGTLQLKRGAWTIRAAYLDEAHRFFGNYNDAPLLRQQDLDAYILNTSYQFAADAPAFLASNTLSGYGYFVENQDLVLSSNRVLGFRFAGSAPFGAVNRWLYTAEYASQQDYQGGSSAIDADYHLLELGMSFDGGTFVVKAAQETLGGDGRYGFQTPFASLHAFNGWADRFLTTPATGLRDRYLDASAKFGPGVLSARLHIFDADSGKARYGKEQGVQYLYQFNDRLFFTAKAANYQADSFSADSKKFWVFADYRY
jgi:hypothetical protein